MNRMIKTEQEEIASFNPGQKEAILTDVKQNVLISAGAGSGKTFTLSYKVYHLVAYEGIDPASLLVLTFTNKAAFEMKERIIKQFIDHQGKESKQAMQIVSSHIQTFDSFSLYLVKKYASLLNLPDTVTIADENVLSTKKAELLDEILNDYYLHDKERVTRIFAKYCSTTDDVIKSFIYEIEEKLHQLIPSRREEFVRACTSTFLSREFLSKSYEEYIHLYRQKMKEAIDAAIFEVNTSAMTFTKALASLSNDELYERTPSTFCDETGTLDKIYNLYIDVLNEEPIRFFTRLNELYTSEETKDLFNGNKQRKLRKQDEIGYTNFYMPIKKFVKDNILDETKKKHGLDFEEQVQIIQSKKEDIELFFEITKRLNDKLDEYKRETNAYSFQDINYLALSLLTDKRYEVAAKEIKNRFKYVLVDEYQDTNDVQETFLNELSAQATLFCVGDAKQSIYRFRNSNVALFMNRKERYEKNPKEGKVISMNWNYRSFYELLDNINSIFDRYMTLSHGGIAFSEKVGEQGNENYPQRLDHDPELKKEKAPNTFYGLGFIQYDNANFKLDEDYEMNAIIDDIEKKIKEKYQIEDKGKFRDCRYSDFAILTRNKKGFSKYQKIFDGRNIPLNIVTEDFLTQINAILLLQSLITLVAHYLKYEETKEISENVPHLFMSVARSYLYGADEGYDDDHIYEVLLDNKKLFDDPILQKIKTFAQNHQESPLSIIFLDLLKEFKVIDKLPSVGDVVSNNDKIESFYQIVLAQEKVGQGIHDFVRLFKNVSKYKVDISAETDSDLENAVSLMTIHKSKGLEMPVVYMPVHNNALSNKASHGRDCNLSYERGLILPHYEYEKQCMTFLKNLYCQTEGADTEEINEHVRIFYVALTRAKQALYIVGNTSRQTLGSKSQENLYDMLNYLYHTPYIRPNYLTLLKQEGLLSAEKENEYHRLIENIKEIYSMKLDFSSYSDDKVQLMQRVYKHIKEREEDKLKSFIDSCYSSFIGVMYKKLDALNLDQQAMVFAVSYYLDFTITSYSQLVEKYPEVEDSFADRYKELMKTITNKNDNVESRYFLALANVLYHETKTFSSIYYDEKNIALFPYELPLERKESKEKQKTNLPSLKVDDCEILFEAKEEKKGRASKTLIEDEDEEMVKVLDYGTRLHSYLEIVDFRLKDTSFIANKEDRNRIDKVLALPLFENLENTSIYKEYSYYDDLLHSHGFIDCLFVKENEIIIIDYKTKEIDDDEYVRQLNVYRRNIEKLMPNKKIKLVLLSILEARTKEVEIKDFVD